MRHLLPSVTFALLVFGLLVFGLLVTAPLSALAQDGQDNAEAGEDLARRWCATCHLVAPDQLLASADAPSFAAIAAESEGKFDWLAVYLADPHPSMPRISLTRQQLRDLSAYLASLRE